MPIDVLGTVLLEDFTAARSHEKALHARFADCRTLGEWFAISQSRALEALSLIDPYAPPAPPPAPPVAVFVETDPEMIKMRRVAQSLQF